MRQSILAFFCIASSLAIVSAHSQVAPAATARPFTLNAGGLGSLCQPDYKNNGFAQTSQDLYGAGAYVDAKFTRWVQIEGEGRWMRFNEYQGINENTYLIGPRIPITNFHGLTPYGKVLVGLGNGSFLTANTFVLAYGGGVDYRLSRRFTLRAFDFEYQEWRVSPTLWPYGGSVGISYKIF
ncbi:MAG: outer membrane beta-barrel protein [Terracidiphilus sp.]